MWTFDEEAIKEMTKVIEERFSERPFSRQTVRAMSIGHRNKNTTFPKPPAKSTNQNRDATMEIINDKIISNQSRTQIEPERLENLIVPNIGHRVYNDKKR